MLIKETVSMCSTCYKRIPGAILQEAGKIYLHRQCSEHGMQYGLVEPDADFYIKCHNSGSRIIYPGYLLDVTNRCNLKCKYCFHAIDNSSDPTIANLIQEAQTHKHMAPFGLSGGEPTLRNDLPELIARLNALSPGSVTILTNGIRLTGDYLGKLLEVLVCRTPDTLPIYLSVHPESGDTVHRFFDELKSLRLRIDCLVFVIDCVEQIDLALALAFNYRDQIASIRLKSAGKLWTEQKTMPALFASDIYTYLMANYAAKPMWWMQNKISFFNMEVDDIHTMIVRWYDITNIDLVDIACPPYYQSQSGTTDNVVIASLINEGMMKGWLNGRRLPGFDEKE